MKVKIEWDGIDHYGVRVTDADTGEEIRHVYGIEFSAFSGRRPELKIHLGGDSRWPVLLINSNMEDGSKT